MKRIVYMSYMTSQSSLSSLYNSMSIYQCTKDKQHKVVGYTIDTLQGWRKVPHSGKVSQGKSLVN